MQIPSIQQGSKSDDFSTHIDNLTTLYQQGNTKLFCDFIGGYVMASQIRKGLNTVMARKSVHVVPNSSRGGWNVRKGGAQRASIHTETKADAVKMGRVISQRSGSELVIHGTDGKIQRSDSHGHDPCPPKDQK